MPEYADLFSFDRIAAFPLKSPADAMPGDSLWPLQVERRRTAIFTEEDQTSVRWRLHAAEYLCDVGQFREAIAYAESVRESDRDRARALACLIHCGLGLSDGVMVNRYVYDLVLLAERTANPYVQATAGLMRGKCRERNVAGCAALPGDCNPELTSLSLFEKAARTFEEIDEIPLSLQAWVEYADLKLAMGQYITCLEVIDRSLRRARETEAWSTIGRLLLVAGKAGTDQGYRRGVEDVFLRSLAWADYLGDVWNRIHALFGRGRLLAFEIPSGSPRHVAEPDAIYKQVASEAEALGMTWTLAAVDNVRAELYRKSGDESLLQELLAGNRNLKDKREGLAADRHEVTERVTREIKTRVATRLQDGIEDLPDAFLVLDPLRNEAGEIRDFLNEYRNQAACRILRRGSIYVCLFSEIRSMPVLEGLAPHLFAAVEHRTSYEDVVSYGTGEAVVWYQRKIVPSGDGAVLTLRDVTAERRIERALREAAETAARSERAKSAFLANMSQQISAPLHGVMGLAKMLAETPLSPTQRAYLDDIIGSGDVVLGLIGEVLDITQLDAEEMRLAREPVVLADLVAGIVKLYHTQAEAKNLHLGYTIDSDVPALVATDGVRLWQILANLVSNAVKFTHRGEISLRISMDYDFVAFAVRDTGIGIPSNRLRAVFDRFQQLPSTEGSGGAGLGLTIAKALTELMGGRIDVASSLGTGSTFTVYLPLPVAESEPAPPPPNSFEGAQILLVDDDRVNALVSAHALTKLGCDVVTAHDGRTALEYLRERTYHLIFMDIQMPGLNGLLAAREIRRLEGEAGAPRTPIIAITAGIHGDEREACYRVGMDDYMIKPLIEEGLRTALSRWLKMSA